MRRPPFERLAWFACGLTGGVGLCLLAADARGAFAAICLSGLGLASVVAHRVPGRIWGFVGALAAINLFVLSLWISPPCDLSDPANATFERGADGAIELICEPRTGMGGLLLLSILGSIVIGLLLVVRQRQVEKRPQRPANEATPAVRIATACAALAFATAALAAVAVLWQNEWSPSALIRMAETDPIASFAREHDPGFKLFAPEAHYDGVYFYGIASDPLGTGRPHELLDMSVHRYTHPLYGWLGWIFSLGRPIGVPYALLLINLLAMTVAGAAFSLLGSRLGASPWVGLAVALNPGLIVSASFDTAEPVGAALLSISLLTWFRGRRVAGGLGFLAVCMTRQPFAVIPIGLAIWELATKRHRLPGRELARRVALLAIGPAAMALWQVYLYFQFDDLPFGTGQMVLTLPFEGWFQAMRLAATLGGTAFSQVGLSSLALLVSAFFLALVATYRALWTRTAVAAIFLGLMAIYLSFEQLAVVFPKELLRFSAIPWMLAPLLFVERAGRAEVGSEYSLA